MFWQDNIMDLIKIKETKTALLGGFGFEPNLDLVKIYSITLIL